MSVTVVIASYNHASFVSEAIQSALDQTRPPQRVVVVDGGSIDDTSQIVRGLPVDYMWQPNAGPAVARNAGLESVTTPWVIFLDADDRLRPEFVARTLRAVKRRVAVVYTPAL